jgi:ribosome maturation factor RimP
MMDQNLINDEIHTLVKALGYSVVELQLNPLRGGYKILLYIYKQGGIGSADCDLVSTTLAPRIQALSEGQNASIEVSTPGIDRVFKSQAEYHIFDGLLVRVIGHKGQVTTGRLNNVNTENFSVGDTVISYNDVAKCALTYTPV